MGFNIHGGGAMEGEIPWRSQQTPVFVSRSLKNVESTDQYRSIG
jgi:hypothetical protein